MSGNWCFSELGMPPSMTRSLGTGAPVAMRDRNPRLMQDVIMREIARQGEGADRPFRVRFDQ
jgi:hypothetical protein